MLKKAAVIAALAVVATAAHTKEQLLVSSGSAKSLSAVAIDMMSTGEATAVQVNAQIDPKYVGSVKFGCGKGAPASHKVTCTVNPDGRVVIIAFSGSNDLLPKGVVTLGTVSVPAAANFRVTEFLASDRNAQPVEVSVVDGAQK